MKKRPIKAEEDRDLPTVRSLKLHILPDQYVAGACFFYSVAQSLHAMSSDVPLDNASLQARAIGVYREMCGLSIEESPLSVNRDLEKDTWGGGPKADYLTTLLASQSMWMVVWYVLLQTNRFSIVTPRFAMDSELT